MSRFKWYRKWIANFRIFMGFCPLCNSDAPDLDSCPLCNGYSHASGDRYPPSKNTKRKWTKEFRKTLDAAQMIEALVSESKQKRTGQND